MRGKPPLVLFTTLARDPRLFQKFFAGGLLDRGNLTLRQRELAIVRTTAKSTFSDEAILELLMLAGFHRTVSYLTNALRLPAEPGSAST